MLMKFRAKQAIEGSRYYIRPAIGIAFLCAMFLGIMVMFQHVSSDLAPDPVLIDLVNE